MSRSGLAPGVLDEIADGGVGHRQHRDVASQLLDADDDRQHDQGADGAVGNDSDQDRDGSGQRRGDDGDECAQEHESSQRQTQRYAQDGEPRRCRPRLRTR